jgi:hypothetical protein
MVHTSTAVEIKRKFYFNIAFYFYIEVSRDEIKKIAQYFLLYFCRSIAQNLEKFCAILQWLIFLSRSI